MAHLNLHIQDIWKILVVSDIQVHIINNTFKQEDTHMHMHKSISYYIVIHLMACCYLG
jgi:hypothetical protein